MKPKGLAIILFLLFERGYICKAHAGYEPDTNSIIQANQTAWKLRNTDLIASKKLALGAINKAEKIKYIRGISYSFNILGHYYKTKGLYDSALFFYEKSLAIRRKLNDTLNMGRSYRNIMSVHKSRGNHEQAVKTGLFAIQLLTTKALDEKASSELAWLKINLSMLYAKTGDYLKAVSYALEGKKIFEEQMDFEGLAASINSIGYVYEIQKQYKKALEQYKSTVKYYEEADNKRELGKAFSNVGNLYYVLNNNSAALLNYRKSIEILTTNGFDDDVKGFLLNIGIIFEEAGQIDSALWYYNRSLDLSAKYGDTEGQCEAHRSLGLLLSSRREYKNALQHLAKALNFCGKSSDFREKIILFKELSTTHRAIGNNDSAFFYANEYSNLNDSLNEILRNSIQLESNLKDKELALALSKETNNKQVIIIIGISLALFLMLIIFWLYSRSVGAKKREFKLKEIIKEKELMAMDAMLEGQEEERKRLGAELHDTIGSTLSATKYAFKAMENSLEKLLDENRLQYQKINKMLDEAMDSVRRISHTMAAGILTDKGLEGALIELCEMFEQSGKIKIELNVLGFDRKIEYITEINLYRILQELMTNILKHSHAHKVNIQLIKSHGNINLIVEDDGTGFNPQDPNLKKGIGILNIDNRVKKLSGTWNIDSGKGKGTTVIIDIPVNEEVL